MGQSTNTHWETNKSGLARPTRVHRVRRFIIIGILGAMSACVLLIGFSALSNILLPAHTSATERLSDLDNARLAEADQLRTELGDSLWSGWGQASIPMILYNEDYVFLVGYPNPPTGWISVPGKETQGGPWEPVPNDMFEGRTYYRQRLADPAITPQAFVLRIGGRWVASLSSKDWMEIGLENDFKNNLPAIIQPVFPYRLAARLFLSAAGGADWYICALLHESFHAFEGIRVPTRLSAAETVFNGNQNRYPWESGAFTADWQAELNLLADAVKAKSDAEAAELARLFLAQRQKRRTAANINSALIEMERQKEWEEGLAKYTELMIWRLAATTTGYQPLPALKGDPDFHKFATFNQRWSQEIDQIRRMASDQGDTRFYYSGLAQAALLDRLAPGWRTKIMTDSVFLEELLRTAIQ